MKVLCAGPESNGTRLLTRIVSSGEGVTGVHLSLPFGGNWWTPAGHNVVFPDGQVYKFDKAVVILRDPVYAAMSAVVSGHAGTMVEAVDEQVQAREVLWGLDALRVLYGELVADGDAVVRDISDYLGVPLIARVPVYNADTKWSEICAYLT